MLIWTFSSEAQAGKKHTDIVQPDRVQATRNLSTSRQNLWYVGILSLARLVDAVSQAHQTDSKSSSAVHFVRNAKFHARNAHIANANGIFCERAAGCAAVAESSVEGRRFSNDFVGGRFAMIEGAAAAAVRAISLACCCG